MSEPNRQYAYFTIADSFDPNEITRRVGIHPSDCWRKGELHPKTGRERKFSRWSLRSRLDEQMSLEEHIRDVLAQLEQSSSAFQQVSREFGGCMELVAYYHEQYTGLYFDSELVIGLAKYALSVDFDFYYLWSDGREDT
jgi:hypothetical protein